MSSGSKCVFPYRSISLCRLIQYGCLYGGMSMPVYSRSDSPDAFSKFFGNKALEQLANGVSKERRRFNVGFVWCVTCGLVFILSGQSTLERLLESEMVRTNSVLYQHQDAFGHTISPVIRALRPVKGVDASYMNTIYSAIFSTIGVSCSNPFLLSRVPYYIRGLLGYMQGMGTFSTLPSQIPTAHSESFESMDSLEALGVMQSEGNCTPECDDVMLTTNPGAGGSVCENPGSTGVSGSTGQSGSNSQSASTMASVPEFSFEEIVGGSLEEVFTGPMEINDPLELSVDGIQVVGGSTVESFDVSMQDESNN